MNFSHILENEVVANEILQDFFEKIKHGSWYLLTVQSERKQISKEEIQKLQEIFGRESKICIAYFYPKNEFILVMEAERKIIFQKLFLEKNW